MKDENFEQFFKANENRIHYQINRLNIYPSWRSEFYTEGIVALWQAYKAFDESKGNIGTFLNYRIRFRLIDLLRKKTRELEHDQQLIEEQTKNMTTGTKVRHTEAPLPPVTKMPIQADEKEKALFWESIQDQLTEKQWKWVQYFIIADLSVKEIMELENVTADAVKNWGRAARRKLKRDDVKQALLHIIDDL